MLFANEIQRIERKIKEYNDQGLELFVTSSFQTHSIPLLHILSEIDNTIPVYFINTGFHFVETLNFRDQIINAFQLNLVDLHSETSKVLQKNQSGKFHFTSDPDFCCFLNKTQPLDRTLAIKDVWINGVRADQNANRRNMSEEQRGKYGVLRYHPMLSWTNKMIFRYKTANNLPTHPLEAKGYLSIGCEPCTHKFQFENDRNGRWAGLKKSECGLHTDLIGQKK